MLLALPSVARAQDQDRYWDANGTAVGLGGTDEWDTTSPVWNQNSDGVTGPMVGWNNDASGGDNAIFNGTAGTVILTTPIIVHNLTFGVNGYTLTGSTLTLTGAAPTITGGATINSIIAGTAGLTKAGGGILTLNGANTFSGGINVIGGQLNVNGDAALGNAGNGISLANGTVFSSVAALAGSRVVTVTSGRAVVANGALSARITGAGGVQVIGTASNDANDYTGQTVFGQSTNGFTSIADLGVASSLGAPTDATVGTISVSAGGGLGGNVIYSGDGDSSNRNWQFNNTSSGGNTLQNAGTGTLKLTGNIVAGGGFTLGLNFSAASADIELLGVLSSTVARTFTFTGTAGRTITLGDANSYTGPTNINIITVKAGTLANGGSNSSLGSGNTINFGSGTLSYTGAAAASDRTLTVSGSSTISNDGTGALSLSGATNFIAGGAADTLTLGGSFAGAANSFSGTISGVGNLTMNGSGTWTVNGSNTFTGTTTVQSGTLSAGSSTAFGVANPLVVNGGTLDLGGFDIIASSLAGTGGTVALGSNTLTLNGASGSTSFAGAITGGGGLTKLGASTLTLTGANSYTGATTIGAGTLALDFSVAGAPASNIVDPASTLIMQGGRLLVAGTTGQAQSFASTTIAAGSNTVTGAGNVTVNLGAINRSGGVVNFILPTSGNITTTPSTVLGGWATVTSGTSTDYAQVDGSGNIVARTVYAEKDDASTWANGDVVADTGGAANTAFFNTVSGNVQLGGLKYTAAAGSGVTVGTGNTLGIDGTIIIASSVNNAGQTISGGSITGAAGGSTLGVLNNSIGTGIFTIASTIVDNGGAISFAKGGTGRVALTGTNSYTGGTTISGGTLAIDSVANGGVNSAIGASSADSANLVLESGTLQYTGVGPGTSDRGFTLVNGGPSRTIQVDSGNLSFGGVVLGSDDAGFAKTGAGTLTLANAANTYTGATTISAGTLSISTLANGGVASGIGASSSDSANLVIQAGGALQYTGVTASTDRGFTLNGTAGGTVDVASAGTTLTVGGAIVGAGPLRKAGAGILVLSGTNTNTGQTIIDAGTLQAGSTQAFGSPNTVALADAAGVTLDLNGFNNKVGGLSGGGANGGTVRLGGATLTIGGTSVSFGGTITGAGGVTKENTSVQTLVGCNNNYTGMTRVNGGTLSVDCLANGGQASGIGASTSASANLVLGGGTLAYTGGNATTDRGFTLVGTGAINVSNAATTLEFSGVATGTSLNKTGPGTLILSGANTYNGATFVNGGILQAGSTSAFGTSGLRMDTTGATLDLHNFDNSVAYISQLNLGITGGNITLGSATLTINNGSNGNYNGAISGSGGLVKNGGGAQSLSGNISSYTGSTVINGGVLAVASLANGGSNSSIGASTSDAGNLVLNGGTLRYNGTGESTDRQFTLGANGGSLDAFANTGPINFTSTAPVAFSGTGNRTLTLTGLSTVDNSLSARIGDPTGGTTALTKTNTGTWVLKNAASTYTGVTNIAGGVLAVDKLANGGEASSIGASSNAATSLVIGSGSTLRYTGAGDTTDRLFTLSTNVSFIESSGTGAIVFSNTGSARYINNGNRTLALGGTNTGLNTMGGTIIDGPGGVTQLAKNDSGTWVLTGNNSYTGDTVINNGNLIIGNGGTTGNAGAGNVIVDQATSTLSFNRSDTFNFTGAISGPGAIAQIGTGTTVLTATNSIGAARVDDGMLQVNGALQTAIFAMNGDGVLTVNGTVEGATAGSFSTFTGDAGASTVSVSAGGTLRATGDLGGGADALNLVGLIATGAGSFGLGAGDDTLTLSDGGTIIGTIDAGIGTDTLVVDNALARTLDAAQASGFEALDKRNTGVLTLTGNHAYSASTTIEAGTLSIGAGGTTGTLAGDVVNDGALVFNRSDASAFAGDISGSGSLTKLGAGLLTFTGDATHVGGTTISAGTLQIGDGSTSGSIAGDIVDNGALVFDRSDSYTYAGSITGAGSLAVNGGVLTLTGDSSLGGLITVGADSQLRVTAGNTVTSDTNVTASGTLTVSGTGSTVVALQVNALAGNGIDATINVADGGVIRTTATDIGMTLVTATGGGSADLNISGTGSLVDLAGGFRAAGLPGSVSDITINDGGTLRTGSLSTIGASAGNTVASTVTIAGDGSNWTSAGDLIMRTSQFSVLDGAAANFVSAHFGTTAQGAALLVSGAGSTFTTAEELIVGAPTGTGALTIADGGRVGTGTGLFIANAFGATGTVNIGAAAGGPAAAAGFVDGAIVFGIGAGTLNFNHTEADYLFANAISGAGTIGQMAGVTRLTGSSSTFTGTTVITGGTLLVDGTLGSAASVTHVLGGGTLGGVGTIGGNVTVGGGAILAAGGNGVGTLTIGGNLDLSSPNAILDFQLGQANVPGGALNDLVNVGGDLNLNGQLNVTTAPGGTFAPGVYRLFNYGGALTGSGLTNLPSGTFVQTAVAGQVNLANTAGLTLNVWDGAAGPKNDGVIQGGTGTWRLGGGQNNWTDANGLVNADYAQNSFALFQGTGGTVTVDASGGAVQTAGMQFTADVYTIAGAPLTLTGAQAFIRVGDGSAGDAGLTATIDAQLAGAAQLVKADGGTLVLTGTNSYTGGTAINGGTLQISSNANLGDTAGGLSFDGGTLHTTASLTMARNIDLAGAGTIDTDFDFDAVYLDGVVSGSGALIKQGIGNLVLRADNSYTGGTIIEAGTLVIGNGGTAGWLVGDIVNNDSVLFVRSDNVIFGGTISGSGTLFQGGAGVLTLTADNSYTGNTRIGGAFASALQLGNGGTTGSVVGDIENYGTLIFNRSNEYGFAGTISGAGDVRQEGTGTTILSAANSYTGSTIISRGTLLINGNQTAATGTTHVLGGGTLGGIGTIGGDVFVGGGATLTPGDATGPGTLTINGNLGFSPNATLAYQFGQSNIVGGPLNDLTEVAGDLALDGTIDVTVSPGGSFGPGLYRVIGYSGALTNNGLDVGTMPAGSTVAVQTSIGGQVNLVNAAGGTFNFWDGAAPANESNNSVDGGDGIWQNSGGNNDWTTTDGAVSGAYTDGTFAIFAAAAGTVEIDNGLGGVTASGLQFASDGYTITGQNLTLVGPESVIRVGDGTAAGLGMTATIESDLIGTGDLVKTDLGTLVLTGASSLAGDATVRTGGLRLADGGTVTSLNTIIGRDAGDQAVLTVMGSDVGGNASTWTSGELTVGYTGTGSLNVTAGGRVVTASGTIGLDSGDVGQVLISGSGSAWQNAGRINVGLFGTGTMRIENGAQVSSNDGIVGGSALGEVVVTGANSSWVNAAQLNVGSFGTGMLRIENGASVISNQGFVGANADGAATVTGAGSNWLVTDFSLTVGNQGNGTLTIENGGRVQALGGLSLGAAAGSNGTLTLLGTAADRGILETSQIGAGSGAVNVTLDGGLLRATRNVSSFLTGFGSREVTLGANGGAVDTNGYDIGIAPRLVGGGGLVKDGAGTLTLTGANAYAGATAVNAGTLLVNGDQSAATGLTSVATTAVLGGIGTIGGGVDMSAGGVLTPGSGGVGTLTINGNLVLGGGSQLAFEFGQANAVGGALNDLVNVGGNLTLDGTLNVTVPAGGSFGPGIYRVFNYAGLLTDNGLALGTMPGGSAVSVQTAVAGQVNLVNTADLTLSFWDGNAGPKNNNAINGGNGVWRVGGASNNWTDMAGTVNADYAQNSFAIFSAAPGTVTIDDVGGAVQASGLQFASDGYTVTGDPLTLTGTSAIVQVGDGSPASSGYSATIEAELAGAARLVKTDAGRLILTGANSYTGGTTIDGGTLQIGNGGATGSIAGDIVNNAALVVNRSGTVTLDGMISGNGTLTQLGGGTLILTGINSYAGGTTVSGGTVRISSDTNLGDVAGTLSLQGGTLQADASFTSGRTILLGSAASNRIDTQGFDVTLTGTIGDGPGNPSGNFLDKLGSGTLTLNGANSYANRTLISGGTLALAGAGTIGAGNLVIAPGTVFDISQADVGAHVIQLNSGPAGTIMLGSKTLTLGLTASFSDWSGTITDGGIGGGTGGKVVINAFAGAVRFFEANSYTGGTTIASGTLELSGNGSLYAGGAVTINSALFDITGLAGTGTTIGDLSGAGSIWLGAKSLTLGTSNDSTSFATITGDGGSLVKAGTGTFVLAGAASHTGGTTIAAGTLQIGNGGVGGFIAGDIGNNGTLAVNRWGELTLDGTISGTGALVQGGLGTTILTASNSYAGATVVNAGTLLIDGDQSAATGLTSVTSGATLGGSGIIGGSVNVSDGGTLAAGSGAVGALTINGDLALASGSRLVFEFGEANLPGGSLNDLVNVGGDLVLDGTIDVAESAGGSFGPGVFRIINYAGTLTNNGLSVGTMPAGSEAFVQTVVPGQVNLVNTAGLTLGFWDGAAGAKNDGAIQGGVGTWRVGGGENNWTEAFGTVNADYAQDSFAIFSGLGGTVTIDNGNGSVRAAGMQFAVDGYTLMGGPLELTGADAFVRVGDGSAADAGVTATIASALTGSARLVKDMGGTLILTGANSYTGGTAINGGTLNVSSDSNLGDAAGGLSFDGGTLDITTTFGSNRAVNLVGTGTFVTQGTGFNLRGAVSGAGALVKEGNGTVTLTADNSYTGGTTINAGVLNLGEGGTTGSILGNIVNNGRFAINRSNMYTLTGTISGSGELFQAGTGTTILTATNSYTGATRVSAGTLLINGDQSAATGLTSLAANATLGGTGTIGGDVRLGNGTLAPGADGAGTLTINGDLLTSQTSTLAYEFGQAGVAGGALNDLVNVGGDLVLDGTLNVTVTPGGAFDIGLYRVFNYGGTLIDNGLALGMMPPGADLFVQTSVANQVNLINVGGALLNFWDGSFGANKFNGAVNGGSGMWRTGLDNSWTEATGALNAGYANGAFAIFAGIGGIVTIDNSLGAVSASGMQFATTNYRIQGDALTLTSPQSVIRVGDGTTAGLGYSVIITSEITGDTQLVKTDLGRLELAGTNSYTGGTAVNGGTLRISSDANLGAASGGLSFNGGTLDITADVSSGRTVDLAGQGVFSTDTGTTLTLTGSLTGTGLIGKLGAGTLVLAGTGSHTGGMEIVQGTLLVNGNYAAATGRVTMNQLTTLGGTGTIGGDVNLSGTLAPGADGVGTLTINGDLLISQTATLAYEFGQANTAGGALNDLVNIAGNLTLDGTINVTVPAGGAFDVGVYRVFNYGGTLTDNGLTLGTMPGGNNVAVQTSIAGQVNLVNSAGLALGFWDGAGGPGNDGVIQGGNGTWQANAGNTNWTNADGTVNGGYSDGAFAVFGGTGGTVAVDNSLGQVTAGGMQFAANGYILNGGSVGLTGPQSTIRVGDGGTAGAGFTATVNAVVLGDTQLVKTDAGTLILAGLNTYTGGTRVTGGMLQISADANLGAADGDVTLDGGTLATSANLSSARDILMAGAGTIATAGGTTFTFNGLLSGSGALSKSGAGTLLITGDNSGFTGSTRVEGTLVVNGSLCGDVNVLAGGRVGGTGTICTTVNAGTIAPGNSIGTLTVAGSYTGNNGTLEIEAALGGDASPTDRLVVTGGTAGTTQVNVINQGGLGAQTVEGIKIVDVTGGTSAGTFTLNGDYDFHGSPAVIAGAYGYRLFQGGVSTPADGDWYLRSALLVTPNEPQVPLYQPGVPVYEAYNQTLLALTDLGTLQQRIGNRQWAHADSGQPSGIWGRMQSNRSRPNAAFSASMSEVHVDSWKLELGADHVLSERGDGATLMLGVLGGYGEANASIGSIYGSGSIKAKSYSAGATLTWFGPDGFYVDGRAQVSWFDSKLKSAVLGTLADGNDGTGQAYSLEVGKRARIGQTLGITPQIQATYSTVGFDRFTDPNDASVSSKLGDSLKTRWGLSIDHQDAKSRLYGVVNLSYEWLDGTITDVSGTRIARENHRLWGEIGVGGSLLLGDRVTLYTEASADTAINDFGNSYSLKATAGLRLAF